MLNLIWKFPGPPSAVMAGPKLLTHGRRQCEINFSIENDEGNEIDISVLFEGVEYYACTFGSALDAEMVKAAYGRVVSLETELLRSVRLKQESYYTAVGRPAPYVRHFMIVFDDGPCFEFIASKVAVNGEALQNSD